MRAKHVAFAAASTLGALAIVLGGVSWLAASMPAAPEPGHSCAVLVLGYPSRADGSPHPVQRSRVATGAAVFRAQGCARLVVSGGAAHNARVEADAMASLASALDVPPAAIAPERAARSTWENVAFSLPLLEPYDRIFVVSEPLHARRARRDLCRQRADLCDRTAAASEAPALRDLWWMVPAAGYETIAALRDALAPREPATAEEQP